ncbi:MAG: flagellar hook-basal body complex protein FliE [Burkholderiales bacterium]|jgi:flagellar hook-basal body complex protein FliE|nr:flagellar hook-basal body complex protein FliE [Burkholderiales bacterium]
MQSPFAPIQGLTGTGGISPVVTPTISTSITASPPSAENARSFSNMLGDALSNVNTTMKAASATTDGLLGGTMENLHEMSIAGAKSEVMLHLTTQIASKLASATTTLFQMQL